jgi:hypothetical protein
LLDVVTFVTLAPVAAVVVDAVGNVVTSVKTLGALVNIVTCPSGVVEVRALIIELVAILASTVVCSNLVGTRGPVFGTRILELALINVAFWNVARIGAVAAKVAGIGTEHGARFTHDCLHDTVHAALIHCTSRVDHVSGKVIAEQDTVRGLEVEHAQRHFHTAAKSLVPHELLDIVTDIGIELEAVCD